MKTLRQLTVLDDRTFAQAKRAGVPTLIEGTRMRSEVWAAVVSIRFEKAMELILDAEHHWNQFCSPSLTGILSPSLDECRRLKAPLETGKAIDAYRVGLKVANLLKPWSRVLVPASEGGRDTWVQFCVPVQGIWACANGATEVFEGSPDVVLSILTGSNGANILFDDLVAEFNK